MLGLTDNAIATIRELAVRHNMAEVAGVRIAADRTGRALRLSLEAQPRDGDEVFYADGARLFMTAEVAQLLENRALDTVVDADGGVSFTLTHHTG
jgi:Fe-S cluster assembly iron-binding protein IscA